VFYGPIAGVLSPADAAAHTELGSISSLAVGDLDGDQAAELVVTTGSGGFLFRGRPSRREGALLASGADLALNPASGAVVQVGGDLDGDGHPELVFMSQVADIVPGPIGPTGNPVRWSAGVLDDPLVAYDSFNVSLGDFNGDGFDDVAIGGVGSPSSPNHGVVQVIEGATPPAR
jgi:hypothetical protein